MKIQPGPTYGAAAYQGANKVGAQQVGGASNASTTTGAVAAANSAVPVDTVTFSAAAQDLLASEVAPTQARTVAQEKLLNAASSDPGVADKLASDMANTKSRIFYDLRGLKGGEVPNKLSPPSGRIVDEAYKKNFASEASAIDSQRLALYNSEKAKGTDPVQIFGKMIAFTNMQSQDYLDGSGWAGASA